MVVTDEEGNTYEFSKFVLIGAQEDGGIFRAIEDDGLTTQEAMGFLLEGAVALGEIARGISETEGGEGDAG